MPTSLSWKSYKIKSLTSCGQRASGATHNGIKNPKLFYFSRFYCQLQLEFSASLDFNYSCGFLFSSCVLIAIIGRKKKSGYLPLPINESKWGSFPTNLALLILLQWEPHDQGSYIVIKSPMNYINSLISCPWKADNFLTYMDWKIYIWY